MTTETTQTDREAGCTGCGAEAKGAEVSLAAHQCEPGYEAEAE